MTRNRAAPVEKRIFTPPENHKPPADGTEWRCRGCSQYLHGVFRGGKLHVRWGERNLWVSGTVHAFCPKCSLVDTLDTRAAGVEINMLYGVEPENLLPRVEATEAAIELARKHQIDLTKLEGSGKDGNILVRDVKAYLDGKES